VDVCDSLVPDVLSLISRNQNSCLKLLVRIGMVSHPEL
jgi:hypothetical protein